MTLIKSISGIRGTIGGGVGDTLNPLDIVKFTSAYATFIRQNMPMGNNTIVVGRDARISGEMVKNIVCGTLMGMGFDVLNIGLATTPTTELAVTMAGADGGIIITASHNPRQWNALKLLNNKGEFLTAEDGAELLKIADKGDFTYADVDHLGHYTEDDSFDQRHIDSVLALKLVDADAIRKAGFKVVVDTVNSVGGVILPKLLDQLGVKYTMLNGQPTGDFAHNPEPLEKNLTEIMTEVKNGNYDMGIVVDPDVDRLVFICEDGKMFGEEYTLVSVADYVLSHLGVKTFVDWKVGDANTKAIWGQAAIEGGKAVSLKRTRQFVRSQMPNVHGMGARDAVYLVESRGVKVRLVGRGKVVKQSIEPGTPLKMGMKCELVLEG